jgi:8-hydroxy-5-deazaflavin:NADPH oxidoreductase
MKIAIIGAGNVGMALANAWHSAGHEVVLGVRTPANDGTFAQASPPDAARMCEVIVLALPWAAAQGVIEALGQLGEKVVIDCMNPLGMVDGKLGLVVGHDISGAELVRSWATGGHIVKSLNQVGAEILGDNSSFADPPVMFIAGDDDSAKAIAISLSSDLGFAPEDAGDLRQARLLEPFGMVWINQAVIRGKGRDWAFVAAPRTKGATQ